MKTVSDIYRTKLKHQKLLTILGEDHPVARAIRRGEEVPADALPSLMEMINSGELEKNDYTLALAAEELRKKSIDASTDPGTDSFPWIGEGDSKDSEGSSPIDKRQPATSDTESVDDIPWITTRDFEGSEENTSDKERAMIRSEDVDSFPWISTREVKDFEESISDKEREAIRSDEVDTFPWIVTRDEDGLNGDNVPEKRDTDVSEEADSFPWIN